MAHYDLLNKRMLVLAGKGGVGKSVLAGTLAWLAAEQGKRTLLVELDTVETLSRIFGVPPAEASYETQALTDNISCIHVDGISGLQEYLQMVLRSKRFARKIFQNPLYQYFVHIAPGLKELMAVGKLWDLDQQKDRETGRPAWDLMIVDTPATGHTLSYMQMPMTATRTVKKGFVNKEARKVVEFLQDPTITSFHIVTTLAEMPVSESIDLHAKLTNALGLPVGCLFVNQAFPPFFSGRDLEAYEAWSRQVAAAGEDRPETDSLLSHAEEAGVLACAESWRRRMEAQETQRERLKNRLPLPFMSLPAVEGHRDDLELVRSLARVLKSAGITEKR